MMPRLREPHSEPDLAPDSRRSCLRGALRDYNIMRTCTAVHHVMHAINIIDQLPDWCLEEVRDFCTEYAKGGGDQYSEFKRAWVALVAEHLDEMRVRDRRMYKGITGEDLEGESH